MHRILLVEDDDDVRYTTVELMKDLGHKVLGADSAEVALTVLRRLPFDVVVTDIGLPGMSGEVFAAEARRVQPDVRIVFVTGRPSVPEARAGQGAPLVRKPFGPQAMAAALKAATA